MLEKFKNTDGEKKQGFNINAACRLYLAIRRKHPRMNFLGEQKTFIRHDQALQQLKILVQGYPVEC